MRLHSEEVHVWRVALACPQSEVETYRCLLSPDEMRRASRLLFERHRRRFIVTRACLRSILSRYLDVASSDVRLIESAFGKPHIDAAHFLRQSLHFNVSHSGELALIALSADGDVGIDVERMRPDFPCERIASHYFSRGEVEELIGLPPHERNSAFYRCWTRKEAFIKAKGLGLTLPLDQFDVSMSPDDPAMLLRTSWDPEEAGQWALYSLSVQPGYSAALAVRGHGHRLQNWTWKHASESLQTY